MKAAVKVIVDTAETFQPKRDKTALPKTETAADLLRRDIPEPEKLCDPWAPEGLTLIAGRPKLGKTTLMRQKLAALGEGGLFLGSQCDVVPSLFVTLEEGQRMMRNKFKAAGFSAESLERIRMVYEWPRGDAGVALLERYLTEYPEIRFVVVDSLTRFRTVPDAKTPAFIADYETLARLHDLTNRRPGLAIDVVHHTRKAKSEDPIDDISGTYGLTAACDTYWVLRAHEDGAVLHVGGRYWTRDESEYKLKRALQRWQLAGTFTGLTRTQEDHLTILRDGNGIFAAEFGRRAGITKQSAGDALRLLVDRGRAQQRNGLFYEKT